MMGRPAKPLVVSTQDRAQLEAMARSQALPAALTRRAQMILRMADGESNSAEAQGGSRQRAGSDSGESGDHRRPRRQSSRRA